MKPSFFSLVSSYLGHNNAITHVNFSHFKGSASSDAQYQLLSSSNDYSARLWKLNRNDTCSVLFSHHRHHSHPDTNAPASSTPSTTNSVSMKKKPTSNSTSTAASTSSEQRNRPFSSEVKQAQFFYQDKFTIMVSPSVHPNLPSIFHYLL